MACSGVRVERPVRLVSVGTVFITPTWLGEEAAVLSRTMLGDAGSLLPEQRMLRR